ncbi:MAG TPA: DUF2071 domain-containing protein [candidate division Zixibacteria bacterium]|nr:DUF2071 domain-containing protein [candidate division Zixibacteria bacterium]
METSTFYVTANSTLFAVAHRPWLPPNGPWAMSQNMQDALFVNYAVDPAALRPLVPERFSIDLYGGAAWLTVTPFYVAHLRGNSTPPLPVVSSFGSVVVRTCVVCDDKPGLFVFSVDSGSLGAVWTARLFWRLPFWHAKVRMLGYTVTRRTFRTPSSLDVRFEAERLHGPKADASAARLSAVYKAVSEPAIPSPGTLEQFLIDRYCIYTQSKKSLYRIENHHLPFMLQQAEVDMAVNTLCEPLGLTLPAKPDAVFYVRNLRLLLWPAQKVRS